MNTVEVLQKARDIVANGWCQNALERDGSFCVIGAVNKAALGRPESLTAQERESTWEGIIALDRKAREQGFNDVVYFNNAAETTQQDVVNLFEKVLSDFGGL